MKAKSNETERKKGKKERGKTRLEEGKKGALDTTRRDGCSVPGGRVSPEGYR